LGNFRLAWQYPPVRGEICPRRTRRAVFQQVSGGSLNQQLDGAGQRGAAMQALHHHQPQHHARAVDAASHFPSCLPLQIVQQAGRYDLLVQIQEVLPIASHT